MPCENEPLSEDVKRIMEKVTEAELKEITKQGIKEAMSEFLNAQMARFGRWSLVTLTAAFLLAVVYFILWTSGWTPPVAPKVNP